MLLKTCVSLVTLELLSWLAYVHPALAWPVLGGCTIIIFLLSCWRLEVGVYAMLAELTIGSQGYIVSVPISSFQLSFRLSLFIAVFLAWCVAVIRQRTIMLLEHPLWLLFLTLLSYIFIAVVVGVIYQHDPKTIFLDVNGYLYLGLAFIASQAIRTRQQLQQAVQVIVGGVLVLGSVSLALLFMFSHGVVFQYYLPTLYKWARDTRLAEITLQSGNFYRVFFQSQIYALFVLGLAVIQLSRRWQWRYVGLLVVSCTIIFLSYSRTFWLSTIVSVLVLVLFALLTKQLTLKQVGRLAITISLACGLGYGVTFALVKLPLPGDTGAAISASSLLSDRTDNAGSEAAGSSRLALLKPLALAAVSHPLLGSGFGSTVTYHSSDPRVLVDHPDGLYTTYAFEWGYLGLWLKLGLIGLSIYLLLLWKIIRGYSLVTVEAGFLVFGIVALACVHMLTPYLDHPLGLGFIALALAALPLYATR